MCRAPWKYLSSAATPEYPLHGAPQDSCLLVHTNFGCSHPSRCPRCGPHWDTASAPAALPGHPLCGVLQNIPACTHFSFNHSARMPSMGRAPVLLTLHPPQLQGSYQGAFCMESPATIPAWILLQLRSFHLGSPAQNALGTRAHASHSASQPMKQGTHSPHRTQTYKRLSFQV